MKHWLLGRKVSMEQTQLPLHLGFPLTYILDFARSQAAGGGLCIEIFRGYILRKVRSIL